MQFDKDKYGNPIKIIPLSEGAIPTEWGQLTSGKFEEEIKKHRFLNCYHYNKCLNHVALRRWSGWSCYWCPLNPFGEEGTREAQQEAEKVRLELSEQNLDSEQAQRLNKKLRKWLFQLDVSDERKVLK